MEKWRQIKDDTAYVHFVSEKTWCRTFYDNFINC